MSKVIEKKVDQIEVDINQLLIATVLDAYEYITLKKLRGDEQDDSYAFTYPTEQNLLERLRNRGLLEEYKHNSGSVFDSRENRTIKLRQHFSITDKGKKYLDVVNQKGLGKELEEIAKS